MGTTRFAPLWALAGLVALPACGAKYNMTDDIDLTWDFGLTLRTFDDDLHTPYVKGAPVTIYVDSDDDDTDMRGWTLVSSDPNVFRIDGLEVSPTEPDELRAYGVAAGEGVATLTVLDDHGEVIGDGVAEVLAPDRIQLLAHGFILIDREGEAPVSELRVLEGGTATYLVRYFRGDRELRGNGVLSGTGPAGITIEPRTSYLFENREWLTVTSTVPGASTITLYADGEVAIPVDVVTVPESDIDRVEILTSDERDADRGDWLVALAQAYDVDGRRIFGVEYEWDIDNIQQFEQGDIYRYEYAPGQEVRIRARRGDKSASYDIHASEGFVDSTNDIGCAVAPGARRAPAAAGLTLAGAGLVLGALVRRRRRRA
jgi:hypothetical protein